VRIELRDVHAVRGGVPALAGVTLDVEPGEVVALLGPSGSGKSTLLAVLAGLHPARGAVRLDGADATRLAPERRGFGMVFQGLALWPHLGVRAHLEWVLAAAKVPRAEHAARVREELALFELEPLSERLPAQLSGGEAQRLALARARVARPRALLLDEPFGALDRRLRERFLNALRAAHAREPRTTVLVTHDPDEAFALATRVAVLVGGRILQCATPEELYRRPANARVAELCGPLTALRGRRDGDTVRLAIGAVPAEFAPDAGDAVVALLRPDELELVPGTRGHVRAAFFHSGRWRIEADFSGQLVTGWSHARIKVGAAVEPKVTRPVWCVKD
jgi:ABC-type Fe3+/spermidine/putrescine transport system ATPase subunit